MSIFARRRSETRSLNYQDVWGTDSTPGSSPFRDGTMRRSLQLGALYAGTGLIADLIATSPCKAYTESPTGVRTLRPVQPKLLTDPDPYGGTFIDWTHTALSSLLLRGNAHGYIIAVDSGGIPSKVAWLNPDAISVVERQQWEIGGQADFYWNGRYLDPTLHVHIRGYVVPGSTLGLSPLGLFKTQIETGLAAQSFTQDWFNNGAAPSGHLKNVAKELTTENIANAKAKFRAAVANRDVLVTGNDWDWTALSVPGDQAKFLETMGATATQIAAILRLQAEDVGGTSPHPLTYKTLLQDQQRTKQRALRPWAARLETTLSGLLTRPVYAKFDLDVNAQGTVLERMQAHAAAMAIGAETFSTMRTAEDLAPMTPDEMAEWELYVSKAAPAKPGDPSTLAAG